MKRKISIIGKATRRKVKILGKKAVPLWLLMLALIVAGAGAAWRGYKGYQEHMKKKKYEAFSLQKFLISVVPAVTIAFGGGAALQVMPPILTTAGIMLMVTLISSGAGIASLQSK